MSYKHAYSGKYDSDKPYAPQLNNDYFLNTKKDIKI